MYAPLLFAIGILLGLACGLIPGLHANTVTAALSSMGIADADLSVLIIAVFPAWLVASFVPSIFFGIPDARAAIAVLPGQRMVLRGDGILALKAVLFSCLFAGLLSFALFPFSTAFFPAAYEAIGPHVRYIVLALTLFFVARCKSPALSALVFLAAGLLGTYALGSGQELYDPFLPLFSGMFAMGAMLNYSHAGLPEQRDGKFDIGFLKYAAAGVVLGMLADLLPGVSSPSQVAAFLTLLLPVDTVGFLAAIAAISVSQGVFSLSTAATIGKSRAGATAWLARSTDIGGNLVLLLPLFTIALAASALAIYLLRRRIGGLASLDFTKANVILALYLLSLCFLLDGPAGVAIFALASALGWATVRLGAERTALMGAVIVPTLLLLFGIRA